MITVYQYDSLGVYSAKVDIDPEDALPPNSTSLAPPKTTGDKVVQWAGGVWVVLDGPPSPAAPDWPALIATRRYAAEMAGTKVQGLAIATDDRSQGLITGAALAAMLDADYTIKWKTAEGFVELTGAQIIGVASAVRAYVQACFDREADLLTAVADGSMTAAMLEEGWPT
jgi:hypothetical protein